MAATITSVASCTLSSSTAPPRVVMIGSPGAGHLIPVAELARRLATDHGFAVTIVTTTGLSDPATDAAVLSTLPPSVATASLPGAALANIPPDIGFGGTIFEFVRRSLPHLRSLLAGGGGDPAAALVCDFFGTSALPLAAELGVPGYVFLPTSFAMVSIMRRLAALHADAAPGEYRDLPDSLPFPGGPSLLLRHEDMPDGFRDWNDPNYAYVVEEARRYARADGFLVNSFEEMERAMAESFRHDAEDGAFPPVFPVGPFVRSSSDENSAEECLEWLNRQPARSVVYVSFGTGGALSVAQTAELAAGLEASGHRFLWVVRMPSQDGNAFAFGTVRGEDDDPLAWLPDGFLERTRGRGLAVAAWAPQVRVLNHPATAAFVSHCGWNSTLESVSASVPIVAWPLYAEQRMNAVTLAEVAGVALRPRDDGGFVTREEVAAVVREIMEGEKGSTVRGRARELQEAASRAWSPQGASRRALGEVAAKWKAAPVNDNGEGA
ncbi:hypothetical protein PR202_gb06708 [Eleusine coracana subsp. coracana]|uniref:Glycosyltransferase n=1 Tax=Eleusine coracana subsp. coracana TaxID=191504 RepID=A0AAV5EA49_ELECO|nr:hypothetical protein QOZ80_2BG0161160 [Eleusine coracana subsp. coracana]GJN19430.1 hypothetical protein PR202_gb06708 [Eleusine coracana subsp. coracana]